MDILTLIILALGVSMDAFAVSVSNSLCFSRITKKTAIQTSFAFGIFQCAMPIIGFFAGRGFADIISGIDHWVALILLGLIGGKMIYEGIKAIRQPESCPAQSELKAKLMLTQAIATSIDALAVGISLAALSVNIWSAAALIGIITFVMCMIGDLIGKKLGGALDVKAQIFGGLVLIFIGVKIFVEHMFF